MGNQGIKNQNSQNRSHTVLIVNHEKFRQNQIHQNSQQSQSQIMRTCLPIQHDSIYTQWEQNVNKLNIDDQNLLLPKSYQFIRNTICGHSGILKIDYDYYPYVLQDQIQNRAPLKRHFEQQQLWYLFYVTVSNAQQFYHYQKKLGDIRPANMFINDTGQLKTSCLYTWPGQLTNYQKSLLGHQITYLSPQQAMQVKMSRAQPVSNPMISQSFSIGLSILQAGILQNMSSLYTGMLQQQKQKQDKKSNNYNNYNNSISITNKNNPFNLQLLHQYIKKWMNLSYFSYQKNCQKKYSDQLKYVILGMCAANPQNRFTSKQVYQWMRPHQIDIVNLHPFQIGMPQFKKQINNINNNNNNGVKTISGVSYNINSSTSSNSNTFTNKKEPQFIQKKVNNYTLINNQQSNQSQIHQKQSREGQIIYDLALKQSSPINLNNSRKKLSIYSKGQNNNEIKSTNLVLPLKKSQMYQVQKVQGPNGSIYTHRPINLKYPLSKIIKQNKIKPSVISFNGKIIQSQHTSGRGSQQRYLSSNISSIQQANREAKQTGTQEVRSFMGSLTNSPLPGSHFIRTHNSQQYPITTNFAYVSEPFDKIQEEKRFQNRQTLGSYRTPHFVTQKGEQVSFQNTVEKKSQITNFQDNKNQQKLQNILKKIDEQVKESRLSFPSKNMIINESKEKNQYKYQQRQK